MTSSNALVTHCGFHTCRLKLFFPTPLFSPSSFSFVRKLALFSSIRAYLLSLPAKNPTCSAVLLLLSFKSFLFLQKPALFPSKCPQVNIQVKTPLYMCPNKENRPHFPVLSIWLSLSFPLGCAHCNREADFGLHSPQELPL